MDRGLLWSDVKPWYTFSNAEHVTTLFWSNLVMLETSKVLSTYWNLVSVGLLLLSKYQMYLIPRLWSLGIVEEVLVHSNTTLPSSSGFSEVCLSWTVGLPAKTIHLQRERERERQIDRQTDRQRQTGKIVLNIHTEQWFKAVHSNKNKYVCIRNQ